MNDQKQTFPLSRKQLGQLKSISYYRQFGDNEDQSKTITTELNNLTLGGDQPVRNTNKICDQMKKLFVSQ